MTEKLCLPCGKNCRGCSTCREACLNCIWEVCLNEKSESLQKREMRNRGIVTLYEAGLDPQEIGEGVGLSRQAVRHVLEVMKAR